MNRNRFNRISITLFFMILITVAVTVQAEEQHNIKSQSQPSEKKIAGRDKWDINIGVGAGYSSVYEGSDEMEFIPMPMLEITWKHTVFLSAKQGLGVYLYDNHGLNISSSMGYDFGRDEDDSDDLHGLGNVDSSVTANLNIEYNLGPVSSFAILGKHLGGSDGLHATFGIEAKAPIGLLTGKMSTIDLKKKDDASSMGTALKIGVSADWADSKYMKDFFGVSSKQASRSGLTQYESKSGIKSANIDFGIMYPVTEKCSLMGMTGYSRLIGDASGSPIVRKKDQVSGGFFIKYHF